MQERTTSGAAPLIASLSPVLAGLAASAALAVDYLQPKPVFCSEGGGCAALRETAFAAVLGVPTPLVGLAGFLALGVASLLAGRRARVAQAALGVIAGLAGAVLLAAQWAFGHFCPYCAVTDVSGIASAFVGCWRLLVAPGDAARPHRGLPFAGAAAMLAAAAAPLGVGAWLAGRAPAVIRAEMARTPPGTVTVVDFVDFECPYCRMTQAALAPLLDQHRVRVVRRQVPLSMHPHALDAARAACCGEQLGKGDAMADALFSAPVESLTPAGCEKIAQASGVPLDAYRACVADPKTDARIASDKADFKAAGGFALPTLWIGGHELVGAQTRPTLEKALGDAQAHAGG